MKKSVFNSRLLRCVALSNLAAALFVATTLGAAEPIYQHGISFFHELKYPADFSHFDYINPDAPKGGVLVQSTQRDFNTLSLITDEGVTAPNVTWIYDSLVSYRAEEMSSFYGWLADGLSVADDKRTLFLRLHPRARWHDGVPITARDVKFTVELIQASIRFRGYFSWVQSVEILGEREIAFQLNSELTISNIFPLSWFPILPAHYWEGRDPTRVSLDRRLGSGPYRIAEVGGGGMSDTSGFPTTGEEISPSTRAVSTSIRSSTTSIGTRRSGGKHFARVCSMPGSSRTFATGRQDMTFPPGTRAGW